MDCVGTRGRPRGLGVAAAEVVRHWARSGQGLGRWGGGCKGRSWPTYRRHEWSPFRKTRKKTLSKQPASFVANVISFFAVLAFFALRVRILTEL